jgi:hypothetical protein
VDVRIGLKQGDSGGQECGGRGVDRKVIWLLFSYIVTVIYESVRKFPKAGCVCKMASRYGRQHAESYGGVIAGSYSMSKVSIIDPNQALSPTVPEFLDLMRTDTTAPK